MEATRDSIAAALAGFERVALSDGMHRPAAVALALVEDAHGIGLLLTRRAVGLRAHAGQWALPGGRVDRGEGPIDAALREMDEEIGVRVSARSVLGVLDDYPTRSGYRITPVVVWVGRAGDLTPIPAEVESVHVASLAQVDAEPHFACIPESDAAIISVPLLGTRIHAPTAAMLHQFREVALHGRATRVARYGEPIFAWQ